MKTLQKNRNIDQTQSNRVAGKCTWKIQIQNPVDIQGDFFQVKNSTSGGVGVSPFPSHRPEDLAFYIFFNQTKNRSSAYISEMF